MNGPIHVSLRIGIGLYVSALTRYLLVFSTIVSRSRSNTITDSVDKFSLKRLVDITVGTPEPLRKKRSKLELAYTIAITAIEE